MSETPETDEVEDMHDDLDVCLAAMTGLARRLEEEREQAYHYLHIANGTAELALKHRDEARRIAEYWRARRSASISKEPLPWESESANATGQAPEGLPSPNCSPSLSPPSISVDSETPRSS